MCKNELDAYFGNIIFLDLYIIHYSVNFLTELIIVIIKF